jgi:hypothetical protein
MLQDQVPLCSHQYERQFNTTRIPGETTDQLVHLKDSKHIAVYCKGKWYKLYAYFNSKVLNAKELEGYVKLTLNKDKTVSLYYKTNSTTDKSKKFWKMNLTQLNVKSIWLH